jgi:hypothetical protein
VTFRSGNRCSKVALDYERTPKSSRQYERICAEVDHEKKLETFLYLVPNCELHAFLLHVLRNARRRLPCAGIRIHPIPAH